MSANGVACDAGDGAFIWGAARNPPSAVSAAYGLGIVLSIEGGVAVKDKGSAPQLVTRPLGCVASVCVVGLAAALEANRSVSDAAFLLIIFLAAAGRVFGPRGHAIGMFAFTSYFMGAYFRPSIAELPLIAIGPVAPALIGHVVRSVVLPDDWRRDLLRSLESVRGRINQILFKIAALASVGRMTDKDAQELRQLEERLKEVVLMAEGFIPRPPTGVFDAGTEPAAALAIRLFDVHLAAESAIVLSSQSVPPFALVHAIIEGDPIPREPVTPDELQAETSQALIRLGEARALLARTIEKGCSTGFAEVGAVTETDSAPAKIDFSLANPLIRSALQVTLASAIAMTFGLMLSRERWFLGRACFLPGVHQHELPWRHRDEGPAAFPWDALWDCDGAGPGDVSHDACGSCAGGHDGCHFPRVLFPADVLRDDDLLRLNRALPGLRDDRDADGRPAHAAYRRNDAWGRGGHVVAFVVFPARTRGALDVALGKWFAALEELLSAAAAREATDLLIALSQKLDAAYRDLTAAARPLGSNWSIVTRPGHTRQTLAIFLAATYWARIMAKDDGGPARDAESIKLVDAELQRVTLLAGRQSECFFVERKSSSAPARHLALSHAGARLGVEMITSTLDRLYPNA